jgi:hypothetical protein
MSTVPGHATLAFALLAMAPDATGAQQNTVLPDLPNPYRTVSDVVTMPAGRAMGSSNRKFRPPG